MFQLAFLLLFRSFNPRTREGCDDIKRRAWME